MSPETPNVVSPFWKNFKTIRGFQTRLTPQTIYKPIKKGKIQKVEISTIDKPGITPKVRVKRGEVEKYLGE